MARYFNSGKYMDCGAPSSLDIVTNGAMSIAGWIYFVTANPLSGADLSIASKGYDGSSTAYVLGLEASGPKLSFLSYNGSVHGARWTYDASFTVNVWHHVYGDYDGSAWHLNFNGVSKATSVDAAGPVSTTKKFYIGAQDANGTPAQHIADANGWQVAHVAIWNAALDAAEITALAKGYSPAFIRPGKLLAYWPIGGRADPEPDLINANGGTLTGSGASLVASVPLRIIMPRGKRLQTKTAAVFVYMRPDADQSDGSWLNELGTNVNLYASVDETVASDTDYIQSSTTSGDKVRLRLSDPGSAVAEPFAIRYRASATSGTASLYGRLYQGASTLIDSWNHTVDMIPTDYMHTLGSTEFASISDFDDLFIEFEYTP